MAARKATAEDLKRVEELAKRWGKIIVRDQWGEQGKLPLQALITWGRGKASHSKVIRIKTSGRVP